MTGISRIFLDTNPLIYFLDKDPLYFESSEKFFKLCQKNKIQLGISTLSVTEYLIGVYKAGFNDLEFFRFLDLFGVEIFDLDLASSKRAARLKSLFNEKTPDLIHLACALENDFDYFLSNDKKLKKVVDLNVLNFEDFFGLN